jgi:hypothetical protein
MDPAPHLHDAAARLRYVVETNRLGRSGRAESHQTPDPVRSDIRAEQRAGTRGDVFGFRIDAVSRLFFSASGKNCIDAAHRSPRVPVREAGRRPIARGTRPCKPQIGNPREQLVRPQGAAVTVGPAPPSSDGRGQRRPYSTVPDG